MGMCIYVSTRLMEQQTFKWRRSDVILAAALSSLAVWNLWAHFVRGVFRLDVEIRPHLRLEVGVGALLLFCAVRFYRYAQQRDSLGFRLLAISLVLWAFILGFRQFHYIFVQMFGQFGHFLGPIPQMLLGVGMLMVLFENERRAVQEVRDAFVRGALAAPGAQLVLDRTGDLLEAALTLEPAIQRSRDLDPHRSTWSFPLVLSPVPFPRWLSAGPCTWRTARARRRAAGVAANYEIPTATRRLPTDSRGSGKRGRRGRRQ